MPAITLGLSEIERQLRAVRRRRNLVTLQQALYVWGGLAVLAAALLVVLALREQEMPFRIAFWAAVATIVLGLGAAGHHLWRRWLTPATAVHWIDRGASLDDRLATLVAQQARPQRTRLASLVVTQLFMLRHRWQAQTLVRRSVPRSVYFFLCSLLALAMTAFLERPPSAPQVFHVGQLSGHTDGSPKSSAPSLTLAAKSSENGDGSRFDTEMEAEDGAGSVDGPRPAKEHHGSSKLAAHRGSVGQPSRHGSFAETSNQAGSTKSDLVGDDAEERTQPAKDELPRRVQDMIRNALGARRAETHEPPRRSAAGEPGERKSREEVPKEAQTRSPAAADSAPGAKGNSHRDEPDHDGGSLQTNAKREGGEGSQGGGSKASGGGGGQPTAAGLFGGDPTLAQPRTALKTFQLNLTLLAQGARTIMEPQKGRRGEIPDSGLVNSLPSAIHLDGKDQNDEALLRTEIPPEQEGIVRRIFSHEQ